MRALFFIILMTTIMQKENKTSEVVFGGGCFWCTEAIFKQLKGVISVSSGYSGGNFKNPSYEDVCSGKTGHAEGVRIQYNPTEITFEKLLEVFFLTHDPTTINQQGADIGTQYRSVIFYTTPDQERIAHEIITKLNKSNAYQKPIVTEVVPLEEFYLAEKYHQNYFDRNKNTSYCRYVIQPKMDKFMKVFNELLKK
jgi:peptide-methionine (S)-S-oxide reductase